MNIGYNLKNQRKTARKSQQEIAKATGISQQALSDWENNKNSPVIEKCIILADYYGISIDELVGHEIKKNW